MPATRQRDRRRASRADREFGLRVGISRVRPSSRSGSADALREGPGRSTVLLRDSIYRRLLVAADVGAATVAVLLACALTGEPDAGLTALLALPIVIGASKLAGLYDRDDLVLRKSTLDEMGGIFQVSTLSALLLSVLTQVIGHDSPRAAQVLGVWSLLFLGMLLARWMARHAGHVAAAPERCLVIGDPREMALVSSRLQVGRGINAEVVAEIPLGLDHEREGTMRILERAITTDDIHRVILAPRSADSEVILDTVRLVNARGIKVSLLPRLFEVVGSSVVFDQVHGVTMLGVRRFGLSKSSAAIKRATDLAGATLGLLVAAPFMLATALAIRLDTKGPVLYRQRRVGRDGHHFEILKFRTMVVDADARRSELLAGQGTGLFKLADDPRVTRVGRFLRRTSLDELPQLLNVLRGDMSLVGPRPLILAEDALVQGWHRRRLDLTPGMTGPWQVLGSSSQRIPLDEMVTIDYLYAANWSLLNDVKILLRTVLHMLGRSGI